MQIYCQGELAKVETCSNPFHIYFLGYGHLKFALEGLDESLIASIRGCQIYNFGKIALKLGRDCLVRPHMFGGPGLIYSNPIHLLSAFIHLLISEDFQFKRGPSVSQVSQHVDNISDISCNNSASKFNPFGLSETIRTGLRTQKQETLDSKAFT